MREVLAVFFLVKLFLQGSAGIFCCQQTLPTSFIMIFLTQPCDFFDTYVQTQKFSFVGLQGKKLSGIEQLPTNL